MDSVDSRLSTIEATQHITLGLISALMSALKPLQPDLPALIAHHLEQHHAQLLAESADEAKVRAFQELQELLLPGGAASS